MYTYKYKAIIHSTNVTGYITANNVSSAITTVRDITSKIVYVHRCWINISTDNKSRAEWFQSLSLLLKQGIRVENALDIIGKEYKFRFSLNMSNFLTIGTSFGTTLDKHGFFFDAQSRKMTHAVERFMKLDDLCDFLGEYYDKLSDRRQKFIKILLPPFLTLVISFILCSIILLLIKEPLEMITHDLTTISQPLILKLLNNLNEKRILTTISVFMLSLSWIGKNLDKIPWFDKYYLNEDIYIGFYCISNALANGVDILHALDIGSSACQTSQAADKFKRIQKGLCSGETFYNMLVKTGFNHAYCSIMRIHEISNDIITGCRAISKLANLNISKQFTNFITVITPILTMCTTGMLIIFLYITIFPIYSSITGFMF